MTKRREIREYWWPRTIEDITKGFRGYPRWPADVRRRVVAAFGHLRKPTKQMERYIAALVMGHKAAADDHAD